MFKYILAATLFALTFEQAAKTTTVEGKKCIPRPQTTTKNLVQQTPSKATSQHSDAVIKSAQTKIQAEWIAFVGTTDKSVPPPPPAAWLKYQETNKLGAASKIPTSFFQKWKQDFKKSSSEASLPYCD